MAYVNPNWSDQQLAAFAWFAKTQESPVDVEGHLVLRARAGTGKTTVVIEGVKRAPESAILICAFSKIIQQELEARIGRDHPEVRAQTLHSVGYGCIRRFRSGIRVEFGSDRADFLAAKVCGNRAPDAIIRLVSKLHTKAREICPHATSFGELTDLAIEFECEPEDQWVRSGYDSAYVELRALEAMELAANIQNNDVIDGSDMIFLPVRNGWLTRQFDLVVVDECQDMTTAQLEIAQGVLRSNGRIAVVGDNLQAIFGFRGADSESLDRLKNELRAGELGLTTTYRCGRAIVDLAQEFAPDLQAGPDNSEGIISYIPTASLVAEAQAGDFILSRVNAPLVSVAMKLLRSGKRTRIAGKDIGKGLISLVRKFKATSVPDFLRRVEGWNSREVTRLEAQLASATAGRKSTINKKIEGVNDQAEMLTSLSEGAKNVTEITDRIEALFSDNGAGISGMITCSSVHRAKGLEADKVFILEDTLRDYNQEEKNICYVAITRAKKELVWVTDRKIDDL